MGKKTERERPSWEESYMFDAVFWATRSSCKYLQNGVVIVKDKRPIAHGYNGAPPGIENCLKIGCRKDREGVDFEDKGQGVCRGAHAETNAMDQIERKGLKGTTLYTMHLPCSACAKEIVGNGIDKVVYARDYLEADCLTKELFAEAGVKLVHLDIDIEKLFDMIRRVYNVGREAGKNKPMRKK